MSIESSFPKHIRRFPSNWFGIKHLNFQSFPFFNRVSLSKKIEIKSVFVNIIINEMKWSDNLLSIHFNLSIFSIEIKNKHFKNDLDIGLRASISLSLPAFQFAIVQKWGFAMKYYNWLVYCYFRSLMVLFPKILIMLMYFWVQQFFFQTH